MQAFKKFIFPRCASERNHSLLLLTIRLVFGTLLMSHGIQKAANFSALAAGAFPDPLGLGSDVSAGLAVFGELVCPVSFITGFLFRLGTIPMIVTMAVAFLSVHGGSVTGGELAFAYLTIYIMMYAAGPGRYSFDRLIANRLYSRNNKYKYDTTTWRRN